MAAKESTRYAINGVLLQRKGDSCIAAATDGHMLLRLRWQDDDRKEYPPIEGLSLEPKEGFSTLIGVGDLAEAAKMPPRRPLKDALRRVVLDEQSANGSVAFAATDMKSTQTRTVVPVEGHFPQYEDCIPRYRVGHDAVEIGVTPELLARLLTAMGNAATSSYNKGIRLVVPIRPTTPIVLESSDKTEGVEATGVLMPICLESPTTDRTPIRHAERLVSELGNMVRVVEVMEQRTRKVPDIQAVEVIATDEVVQAVNSARQALELSGCHVPAPFDDGAETVESEDSDAGSDMAQAA